MTEIKKLDKSCVEITGSIPAEVWERFRGQAIKRLNESISIDGFRKGNIPENILISKVGEMAILEEMAELALPKAYVDILIENKIDAIGKPSVHVTKLAKGNPLEFKATTAVVPEVKLPEYKKLAAIEVGKNKTGEERATDKEIEEAILKIRRTHAEQRSDLSQTTDNGSKQNTCTQPDRGRTSVETSAPIEAAMPELTDDFVKGLGDFKDIPDFKAKLSVMIAENKKDEAKEKARIRMADTIAEKTAVELPDIMIESELRRTEAQFNDDIERMGVKVEDYLKHAKKSIEDIRKEWRPMAEKKAKLQLILNEIAKAESIKPSKEAVEAEVKHILEHYKDADRERAEMYAETILTNEKVFQFLENPIEKNTDKQAARPLETSGK